MAIDFFFVVAGEGINEGSGIKVISIHLMCDDEAGWPKAARQMAGGNSRGGRSSPKRSESFFFFFFHCPAFLNGLNFLQAVVNKSQGRNDCSGGENSPLRFYHD